MSHFFPGIFFFNHLGLFHFKAFCADSNFLGRHSFHSCSHGAGRMMSRGDAKRSITLTQHKEATINTICRQDKDILDESPAAYKDINLVMQAQADLIDIVHTLKEIVNIKG